QGFLPTAPNASTGFGSSPRDDSGRHSGHDTRPGSTSSKPSKNRPISSGDRSWYGTAPPSLYSSCASSTASPATTLVPSFKERYLPDGSGPSNARTIERASSPSGT